MCLHMSRDVVSEVVSDVVSDVLGTKRQTNTHRDKTHATNKTNRDHTTNKQNLQGTRPHGKRIARDPPTRQTKTNRNGPDHATNKNKSHGTRPLENKIGLLRVPDVLSRLVQELGAGRRFQDHRRSGQGVRGRQCPCDVCLERPRAFSRALSGALSKLRLKLCWLWCDLIVCRRNCMDYAHVNTFMSGEEEEVEGGD